jgi:Pvc16 N-terminal domain
MSNALAIATVTTALAQIVRTAAQSVVNGADVLTGRPDPNATPAHRIHLFLYQVSPNTAMRNWDLPLRASEGGLVARPTAALDLHYLLAFYGSENELETQRMLGAVVRDLHSRPVLTRSMIQAAIASQTFLAGSNLVDAVEQVKFTPLGISLEEMSKIWSIFYQIPYALSVAYQGTVILIESDEPARPTLPVLSRGEKDRGVDTLLGPFPVIESAYFGFPQDPILQKRPISLPAAQLGLAVIVGGRNLRGEGSLLRFRHTRRDLRNSLDQPLVADMPVLPDGLADKELRVALPLPGTGETQTDWAPGVYTVTAVQRPSGSPRERIGNDLPMALAPIIAAIEPGATIPRDAQGSATIILTCRPRVHSGQQAVLLVAGREIAGRVDSTDPDKLVFVVEQAAPVADAPIRLRVDGIESMPFKRVDIPPPTRFELDPGQRVTIT